MRVRFAFKQTADEQIEELVRAVSVPKGAAVVSNDGRRCRRRPGARGAASTRQEFVDWLIAPPRGPDEPPPPDDKPVPDPTAAEIAAWEAAFSQKKR